MYNTPTWHTETTLVVPHCDLCFLQTAQFGCSGHGTSLCVSLSFIILFWNGRTRWQWVVPWIASWLLYPPQYLRTPQAVWISRAPMAKGNTFNFISRLPTLCSTVRILSRLSLWPTFVLQYLFIWGLQGIPRLGLNVSVSPLCSYDGWYVNHCLVSPEHNPEPNTKCTNDKDNSA